MSGAPNRPWTTDQRNAWASCLTALLGTAVHRGMPESEIRMVFEHSLNFTLTMQHRVGILPEHKQ